MMTKKIWKISGLLARYLCIGACFVFWPSPGLSGTGSQATLPRHAFEVGFGMTYLDYQEDLGMLDMEIDGLMYGLVGSYTYHDKFMLNASVEYQIGDLDYDGVLQTITIDASGPSSAGSEPAQTDTEDWTMEGRGLIGYDFVLGGHHTVTPFFGIGYRYWSDDIKGFAGYERKIEYVYSPLGLKTHSPLSDEWTWGLSLEYDLFWDGRVDVDAPYFPALDQDHGFGLRFSLRFDRPFGDRSSLYLEPYVRYWDMDRSERKVYGSPDLPGIGVFEPENTTTSYGLRIGLRL